MRARGRRKKPGIAGARETINPEVEVVTLDKLVNSITSYGNDYSFSPEQQKLMREGILKQASHAIKQSE